MLKLQWLVYKLLFIICLGNRKRQYELSLKIGYLYARYFWIPLKKTICIRDNVMIIKDIKLPYNPEFAGLLMHIYRDIFLIYAEYNDNYEYADKIDKIAPEGSYLYRTPTIDFTIKPGDVVIDAGAWIGDFSAYASVKGAKVYAFEPTEKTLKMLHKTADLNKNITIVPFGLSDKNEVLKLYSGVSDFSLVNVFSKAIDLKGNILCKTHKVEPSQTTTEDLPVITLDSWVKDNHIQNIDFIKMDIEGAERYMLQGAKETIKRFKPKISACTYHFPEDPELLKDIILSIEPSYNIMQRKAKLFAWVNK